MNENELRRFESVYSQFFNKYSNEIRETGRKFGSGRFSIIKEVEIGRQLYAAKLIEMKQENNTNNQGFFNNEEVQMVMDLTSPYFIKIKQIYKEEFNNRIYHLIIMEKAQFKDLQKLCSFIYSNDSKPFKLINNPFIIQANRNLIFFLIKPIISGLTVMNLNNIIHFDIKPANLLILSDLVLKFTDLSIARNLTKEKEKQNHSILSTGLSIPGGTEGYFSPEYFLRDYIDMDLAFSQDYFSFGCVIYFIIYGEKLLNFPPELPRPKNSSSKFIHIFFDRSIEIIKRGMNKIETDIFLDKRLKKLITKLLQYKPNDRANFEIIYRNPWINDEDINKDIKETVENFPNDETKYFNEFQKHSYLSQIEDNSKNDKIKKAKFIPRRRQEKKYRINGMKS